MASTIPSAILRDGGWKPADTRGLRSSRIMFGAVWLMAFQTKLGVSSGPGADDGNDLANALEISDSDSSEALMKGRCMVSLGGKG